MGERAGLPAGTAANYFPRRDDLLAAAAERVAEVHVAEMTAAGRTAARTDSVPANEEALAQLIGASLYDAVTRHRARYLTAYELAFESTRQPEFAAAMSRLGAAAMGTTLAEHRSPGLPTTAEQVQALITLYNGTLLMLIAAPP
jgi:AcrR family transcriptional regulator